MPGRGAGNRPNKRVMTTALESPQPSTSFQSPDSPQPSTSFQSPDSPQPSTSYSSD